jgi:hypothetical protein
MESGKESRHASAQSGEQEVVALVSVIGGALPSRTSCDYIPPWMLIHGVTVGVMRGCSELSISIRILWNDRRGRLFWDGGPDIKPGGMATCWLKEYWHEGLEGLIKMTLQNEARRWESTVARMIDSGAFWCA